jgi:DNA-binding response OmpR family regulator
VDSASDTAKQRILIVEDEMLVRMFAVDALEDEGFKVEEAANAAEGLTKLAALGTSLAGAIIDLGLPDRSGDEVATEVRKTHPDLPILIASGRSERELKDRFGGDARMGIVVKPFTATILLDALDRIGVRR